MANILVVDDDEIILKVVRASLTKVGHSVTTARDGLIGLECLSKELFDLIISDANMPGLSGFDLVEKIRKLENYKYAPIMFLTGRTDRRDITKALESGADDYTVKPIDQDIFMAKIEALLQTHKGPHSFASTEISEELSLSFNLKMVGISEQGVIILSSLNIPLNTKVIVNSTLLKSLGLLSTQLRVASCTNVGDGVFNINANFIGLKESEHSAIRLWIMKSYSSKSKYISKT